MAGRRSSSLYAGIITDKSTVDSSFSKNGKRLESFKNDFSCRTLSGFRGNDTIRRTSINTRTVQHPTTIRIILYVDKKIITGGHILSDPLDFLKKGDLTSYR